MAVLLDLGLDLPGLEVGVVGHDDPGGRLDLDGHALEDGVDPAVLPAGVPVPACRGCRRHQRRFARRLAVGEGRDLDPREVERPRPRPRRLAANVLGRRVRAHAVARAIVDAVVGAGRRAETPDVGLSLPDRRRGLSVGAWKERKSIC